MSASTTPTFKSVIYKILNRQPFTRYMTISLSNINLGWDVTQVDQYFEMSGVIVKTVFDNIMLMTGSVYYVNYDQEFVVEPIIPSNPVSVCTFRGEDIYDINTEEYDWHGQFTGIKWLAEDDEYQRIEMPYSDRELYQYDYSELELKNIYITNTTVRLTIMQNLLSLYQYLKRQIKITCKWNPDVLVNTYVTLDVAEEAIINDEFLIWNKDQWNEGKYWGIASPGISFESTKLWRVVDINRDSEGEKMKLTLVQQYSDDEE